MTAAPYLLHRQARKSSFRHFAELSALTLSFVSVSSLALFGSLGYHVNIQARTVERFGGVSVAVRNNVPATVRIDGSAAGTTPLRVSRLSPGSHHLTVTSDGYQPFTTDIRVSDGTVAAYKDIFLVLATPKPVPVDRNWLPIISVFADKNLEIRSGNELWQDNLFLTRTSGDILQVRYSADTRQIFYQEGDTLWLYTPSSQTTVQLLKVPNVSLLPFDLRENGRILLYEQPLGTVQALALY